MKKLGAAFLAYLAAAVVASFVTCMGVGVPVAVIGGIFLTLWYAAIPAAILVAILRALHLRHPLIYGPAGVLTAIAAYLIAGFPLDPWLLIPVCVGGLVGGFIYFVIYAACTSGFPVPVGGDG